MSYVCTITSRYNVLTKVRKIWSRWPDILHHNCVLLGEIQTVCSIFETWRCLLAMDLSRTAASGQTRQGDVGENTTCAFLEQGNRVGTVVVRLVAPYFNCRAWTVSVIIRAVIFRDER